MNIPLCSIVIPTYNHGRYIERSISSALAQTYSNIEIIVIDDGSTDDTSERVKKFGNSIIYHRKINGGLGAARNTGIELSKGEYIQFLDADDLIDPAKIEQQVKAFDEDNTVAVVYSDCSGTEPTGNNIENNSYQLSEDENPIPILFKRSLFPVHACLIKRAVIIDAGMFDKSRLAQEDWDLWLRVALKKYKFKYLRGNLAHYDQQGSTMTNNPILMFKRTQHMMLKFLSDPLFNTLNKKDVNSFISSQSILLATRAYNNQWWKLSRHYFLKAVLATPGKIQLKYWLCIPKSFLYQTINKIKGKKNNIPEELK